MKFITFFIIAPFAAFLFVNLLPSAHSQIARNPFEFAFRQFFVYSYYGLSFIGQMFEYSNPPLSRFYYGLAEIVSNVFFS